MNNQRASLWVIHGLMHWGFLKSKVYQNTYFFKTLQMKISEGFLLHRVAGGPDLGLISLTK